MFDIVIWSSMGILLLIIECFVMEGIGILFAGLSAITVATITYINIDTMNGSIGTELFLFFLFTFIWGGILWLPLHHIYGYAAEDKYKNVIGSFGTVHDPLSKEEIGTISWGGTLVKARLDEKSNFEALESKTHVKITHVTDDGLHIVRSVREETDMSEIACKKKKKKAA